MALGGGREEIDLRFKKWEQDLERLRLLLARAPEEVHARWNPDFVNLYRQKEVAKSAWEAIRGTYRPEPEALQRYEQAWRAMEATWAAAQPMLTEVLAREAA
jgi:hypothetical protein